MSDDISSKVKKIVADHLGIDEAKVTEESPTISAPISSATSPILIGSRMSEASQLIFLLIKFFGDPFCDVMLRICILQ